MFRKLCMIMTLAATPLFAQDKAFTLQSPPALTDTGFLQHIVPRFSLKTGVRITVTEAIGDAAFGGEGAPVFRQGDTVWALSNVDAPNVAAFYEWLTSDVGKRTIEGYVPENAEPFSADVATESTSVVIVGTGDVALGEDVSLTRCGRCHVVNEKNRMNAIGSTPSFALMRNFADWQGRFQTFFLLKPHPAFTQVADVTDPFPDNLPSPIAPIEVTLDEIDAIVAYVGTIAPADLGAPVQSQ